MKEIASQQRPYQEVGKMLRSLIVERGYSAGTRLPPEREIAEILNVSRTVIREALIMLEIEGILEVRRGAGIFVMKMPYDEPVKSNVIETMEDNDAGPFEILQARQLLESNIAEFAALQATREDIIKMRRALLMQEEDLSPVTMKQAIWNSILRLQKRRITRCSLSFSNSRGNGA